MNKYYLHIGSNQGNRKDFLLKCIDLISNQIGTVANKSSIYETEPWGNTDQNLFLNMALEVSSSKTPSDVLAAITNIQTNLGTTIKEKWGPRNIDIDIIYVNDEIINSDSLTIPHPNMYNRNFVLVPMIEIAGEYEDPVKKITVDELYDECTDKGEVYIFDDESDEYA